MKKVVAPALALAALGTAQAASAQAACVAPADLGDAVVYAMPIAYDAARTACANRFKPDGFMAKRGDAFIADFRTKQNAAWPGAFRLLKTFMANDGAEKGQGEADMSAMIAALPEDSLRPFVDGLVGQMIATEIKGDSCGQIERAVELLSPLPSENVAGLFTFIAEMTDLKNPPICPAKPAPARR